MIEAPLKGTLAVDARMVRHSGIGVVLRHLVQQWLRHPPCSRLLLLGDPVQLEHEFGAPSDVLALQRWTPRLYAPAAALSAPRLPADTVAWYSPHYATCLRPGVPLVCHVQDLLHITHRTRPGTDIYMRLYLAGLRRAAACVLTSSRLVKVQLQTLHRFAPERLWITGLAPGFAHGAGLNDPPPEGLTPRGYFLAVGIVKPHKNWGFLLRRLAVCQPYAILAAAGYGAHGDELKRMAEAAGYTGLRLIPPCRPTEMAALFRNARALLFPSLAEGYGLPIVEAMSVGTPVVVAERSPMRELAAGAGFYFDPDWPESFDAAVRAATHDAAQIAAKTELGRKLAARLSWEAVAARTAEAIRWAATGAQSSPPADPQPLILP